MGDNHKEELKEFMEKEEPVTFVLRDGTRMIGRLNWVDDDYINVTSKIEKRKREITISKSNILCYYKHLEEDEMIESLEQI